jgi:hypothetical protein
MPAFTFVLVFMAAPLSLLDRLHFQVDARADRDVTQLFLIRVPAFTFVLVFMAALLSSLIW